MQLFQDTTLVSEISDKAMILEHRIRARTGGRVDDLHVSIHGDEVILSGTTRTYYAKQLATHAAMDALDFLAGGGTLTNSIAVR